MCVPSPPLPRSLNLLLAAVILAAGGAASAQAADDKQPARQPNVLWLTSEDMSADLGCYGVEYADTPTLDKLAGQGVRYTHCFATSGVCAPARSCLIMGVYPSSIGSHHMRSQGERPEWMHQYPWYLRQAGYYCTNNTKTDYNMPVEKGAWDENSNKAHYRNRQPGQPFFAVFNYQATHESRMFGRHRTEHDPAKAPLPPYHPDHGLVREDWARYHDNISGLDKWAAGMLAELEKEGVADDTIVFYYSDHGAGLPRGKRWLYDSGMHVPLIIRFGKNYKHLEPGAAGTVSDRLVSFVDFAPTLLSLCGVEPPEHMHGQAFLGQHELPPRELVYGIRGRIDERYDMVRAVRDHRYKYIRNFMPHKPYSLYIGYMYQMETMQVWQQLHDEGKLSAVQEIYFSPRRPAEELYDTQADPWEVTNLAGSPEHRETLGRLRGELASWMRRTRDVGLLAEPEIKDRPHREGFETAYEWAHAEDSKYPLDAILEAAAVSQTDDAAEPKLIANLKSQERGIRFWAALHLNGRSPNLTVEAKEALAAALDDDDDSVSTEAAQALLKLNEGNEQALIAKAILPRLDSNNEWIRLRAATVLDESGEKARPYLPQLKQVVEKEGYPARVAERTIAKLRTKSE